MAQLTLKQANTIIEKGFAKAREMKIKPLGIVVLDAAGHIVSAQREDGASMFRLDVAQGKAWAAVAMGASSKALAKRAKDNPNFFVDAGGDRERQVPAANRRRADQGQGRHDHRRRRRQRRHGRGRRGVLRGGNRGGRPYGRRVGLGRMNVETAPYPENHMSTYVPAEIGMPLAEVDTPALILDLDAFERNLDRLDASLAGTNVKVRPHAKSHKCPQIALRQIALGAVGVCCQKVSEAEAHGGRRREATS